MLRLHLFCFEKSNFHLLFVCTKKDNLTAEDFLFELFFLVLLK